MASKAFDSLAFKWAAAAVRREQKALKAGLELVRAEYEKERAEQAALRGESDGSKP